MRMIEVTAATAKALEARAEELGTSVSELVAELVILDEPLPKAVEEMRRLGRGPWAPSVLAEDARRYAEFKRTRKAIPWEEVRSWMQSWGTAEELPKPKPRKL